jgi:hypothetical protein
VGSRGNDWTSGGPEFGLEVWLLSEEAGDGGRAESGHAGAAVVDLDGAVAELEDRDLLASDGPKELRRWDLEGEALEGDGVVLGDGSGVLEAEDPLEGFGLRAFAEDGDGIDRRDAKTGVVVVQDALEDDVGLLDCVMPLRGGVRRPGGPGGRPIGARCDPWPEENGRG